MTCESCEYYYAGECRRYPIPVLKSPGENCGEWRKGSPAEKSDEEILQE